VTELKTWQETYEEAYAEACLEQRGDSVLTTLRARGIAVTAAARQRIAASKDEKQLTRWLKRAAVAASIDEVFDARRRSPRTRGRASAR
jgi:post-segregation antitoxin (ccd killing protein)